MSEVLTLIEREFVVPVPAEALERLRRERSLALLDPYSDFLDAPALAQLDRDLAGRFGGVGVRLDATAVEGGYRIRSTLMDSPALAAGIVAGDVIEAVDGRATSDWTLDQMLGAMIGEPGSAVVLDLRSADGSRRRRELSRAEIVVPSVHGYRRDPAGKWSTLLPDSHVAYVRVTGFAEGTVRDFEASLERAQAEGATALVIDLRGNFGGLSSAAVAIADELLDAGRIVIYRQRAEQDVRESERGARFAGPLAVLVDDETKSAGEILAAALADSGRAIAVGTRTWGKGSMQQVFRLDPPNGGAVLLTIAHYLSPTGAVVERHGAGGDPDCGGVWPDLAGSIAADQAQWAAWREELYRRDGLAFVATGEPLEATAPGDPVLRRALELLGDPEPGQSSRPASCSAPDGR